MHIGLYVEVYESFEELRERMISYMLVGEFHFDVFRS